VSRPIFRDKSGYGFAGLAAKFPFLSVMPSAGEVFRRRTMPRKGELMTVAILRLPCRTWVLSGRVFSAFTKFKVRL
jgi:hypothetical protein